MQNITVSVNNNVLKISTILKDNFKAVSIDVPKTVLADYKILDVAAFAEIFQNQLTQLLVTSTKKVSMTYILEPQVVVSRFVTVNKQNGDPSDQIISEITQKLQTEGLGLENLFFGYQKIAPFVYQFVGVDKEALENVLSLSTTLGIALKGVFSWPLLLPKFTDINTPAIFLFKYQDQQIVILSEFGGVFFSGVYSEEKSANELHEIVETLSIYKRNDPINKIYTYNYPAFSMDSKYSIEHLEIPNSILSEAVGYEIHLLTDYVADTRDHIYLSNLNLLSLLPLPALAPKSRVPMLYAGGALVSALLVVGLFGGISHFKNTANKTPVQQEVLSDVTESTQPVKQEEPVKPVLVRSDLKIRVENGAGVAGIAGKTQTLLEGLGYKVTGIGNSDESNRETTLLKFNTAKKDYKDLVSEDLKEKFKVVVEENLNEDVDYELLIVVGTDAQF